MIKRIQTTLTCKNCKATNTVWSHIIRTKDDPKGWMGFSCPDCGQAHTLKGELPSKDSVTEFPKKPKK